MKIKINILWLGKKVDLTRAKIIILFPYLHEEAVMNVINSNNQEPICHIN